MEKEIEILCEFKFVFKWAPVAILEFSSPNFPFTAMPK
jgi:hypothetical protein